MWARWLTMLSQIDRSLEQLLLVENSADTRDSSPSDQLVLAKHSFGKNARERRCIVGKLSGLPKGIDRLMTLKLPLSGNQHTAIIGACAITMTSQMESKLSFTMIWTVLFRQHPSYKLISLGGLNARVGTGYQAWDGLIGPVGIGNCFNENVLSMTFRSPIQSSVYQIAPRHHRCIFVPNTGISLTMP